MLDAARSYLARGLSIIPLRPNDKKKRPLLSSWLVYQERLPTQEEISDWWTRWPKANIAIVTGAVSGIVALDVDGREVLQGRAISATPTVQTRGGRWHYYLQHPGFDCRNFVKRWPGLDFRGDGGYVVAPPSIHPETQEPYTWVIGLDVPFVPIPDWLRPLIKSRDWATEKLTRGVPQGERNDSIAQVAGRYLGAGHPEEEVLELLLGWNLRKVRPPLPEEEVRRTVESIAKAEYRQRAAQQLLDPDNDRHRARIARAIAAGTEISPNGELPEDEARRAVLDGLSTSLGVRISRILKYGSEPSTYFLETETGRIRLGDIRYLTHQEMLRDKLAELMGHYLRTFSRDSWQRIAQRLLDACETIEVGADATEEGAIDDWLQAYIDENPPAGETDWKEAALLGQPFSREGALYISLREFRRYVIHRFTEKVTRNELALLLKTRHAEYEVTEVHSRGAHSRRGIWRVVIESKTAH